MRKRNYFIEINNTTANSANVRGRYNMNSKFPKLPVEYEYCIVCRHGEVWEVNALGEYKAVIVTPRVANKVRKLLGKAPNVKAGEEVIVRFNSEVLPQVLTLLVPFENSKNAKNYANDFNRLKINMWK